MIRIVASVLGLGLVLPALAQDDGVGGPLGAGEEWLLAQPRLTLSATAPDPLPPGRTTLRLRFDWGNDFGWSQAPPGEAPTDRRFLVDGEHRTLDLQVRRGVLSGLDVGARLPLRWRGAGALDGVIDWWHGFTNTLGLPDNLRPFFLTDRFRVEGRDAAGTPLRWTETGTGLGNLELDARWRLVSGPSARVAVVARAMLPTATGPFETRSVGAGVQLVAARALGRSWDLQGGIGGTTESQGAIDGIRYEKGRLHAFAATQWRTGRRFSLLAETTAAGRLVTNLADYPGLQWYLNLGARMNLDSGFTVEGAFSENLAAQQSTTDFAVQIALVCRLR